jgi:23S rRNA (uracil1939-C5)-methyltransferase
MAIGELCTVFVEGIAKGGAGVARLGEKRIFIDFCAPGDRIKCRIVAGHPNWIQGELVEIEEASPQRVKPVCPLYGICGGCSMQHLAYEAQLRAKTAVLKDTLAHIGGFTPPEPEIFPSPPLGYRNRVELHRCDKPALSPVAFRARKSETLIPITACPVADPAIQAALKKKALLPPPEKNRFTVYAREDLLISEGGRKRGKMRLLDRELALDAGVFFQSNALALELLINKLLSIAAEADPALPVADIYCGVGVFAAFLSDRFSLIDLIEENKTALALARENVKGEGKEFFALKDEEWAAMRLRKTGAAKTRPYGFAAADPPRQGLSPELRRWLIAAGPPVFAYVSCDPATLARDAGELVRGGYEFRELHFYDFYPQTAHIESLSVFIKNI